MFEPLTEAELVQELREMVIKKYDHSACDSECESNAMGIQLLSYLIELRELRKALEDIAHNTSMSVPLGAWPVHHYADTTRRCIAIAANALKAPVPSPADATHSQVIGGREG